MKRSEAIAEIKKLKKQNEILTNLNNKLRKWHAKTLRHSMHLGDQNEEMLNGLKEIAKDVREIGFNPEDTLALKDVDDLIKKIEGE